MSSLSPRDSETLGLSYRHCQPSSFLGSDWEARVRYRSALWLHIVKSKFSGKYIVHINIPKLDRFFFTFLPRIICMSFKKVLQTIVAFEKLSKFSSYLEENGQFLHLGKDKCPAYNVNTVNSYVFHSVWSGTFSILGWKQAMLSLE